MHVYFFGGRFFVDVKASFFKIPTFAFLYFHMFQDFKVWRLQDFKTSRFQDPHFSSFRFFEILRCEDCKVSRFQDLFSFFSQYSNISSVKIARFQDFRMCILIVFAHLWWFLGVEIARFRNFKISRFQDPYFSSFRRFRDFKVWRLQDFKVSIFQDMH